LLSQVARSVASHRLIRVERGVYEVDGLPTDPDRAMCATILAARGLVAISHLSAARRLTIPGYRQAPWEISIQRGVRLRRSGLRVHESTDLDRCQIIQVFVAEVDMAYPERRIALECDGDVHLEREVREKDLPRQNDLVLLGWQVLRYTPARYWTRPERIVAEVRDAYRARPTIPPTGDSPPGQA
jgi:very-short-patch-repair endonuclease